MRRSPLFYVGSIRRTPRACEPPHPSYQRGFVQARDDFVEHRRPFILTELEARRDRANDRAKADHLRRSEEHTSELQSLMRISYAVFCLKKKKITNHTDTDTQTTT